MGMKRELDVGNVPFQISDGSVEIKFGVEGQSVKGVEFFQGARYAHSTTQPTYGFPLSNSTYIEYGGHLPTWVWSDSDYVIDVIWCEEV
jgi:hypothetical protein